MSDSYSNDKFGFSFVVPDFKVNSNAPVVTIAAFLAPPEDGFSANLNVQVHRCGFDYFVSLTDAQFSGGDVEVISKKFAKVGERAAVEYVYKMNVGGNALQFLAVGVDGVDRVHLFTCTALEVLFSQYVHVFRDALASLRFDN
jgi:hypothetical protein